MAGVRCPVMSAPVEPSPSSTLTTPAGKIPSMSRARTRVDPGVVSEGLRTTVLPAASAGPSFQIAISSG